MTARDYQPWLSAIMVIVASLIWPAPHAQADDKPFKFIVLGDTPYSTSERALVAELGSRWTPESYLFALHVGDIKSGGTPCDDQTLDDRFSLFNNFKVPFILLFGDNEWTDCHRRRAGAYQPQERLTALRKRMLPPKHSLGNSPLKLVRQPTLQAHHNYPENIRWQHQGILFLGLHIVGSNNNIGNPQKPREEYSKRNAANLDWIKAGFKHAREQKARAIVIAFHADPLFELSHNARKKKGYNETLNLLAELSLQWNRPVLLIHGDTHQYRLDQPLTTAKGESLPNVSRLETAGSPWVSWVEVTVDPRAPQPFVFTNHNEGLYP